MPFTNASAQAGRAEASGQTARRNPALPEADGSPNDDQFLLRRPPFMWPPEPRRGGMIIAQGKAAEAAALGKSHPTPPLSFPFRFGAPRARQTGREKERKSFWVRNPGRRSFRLPWAIITSSLRDFSLARSARIVGELVTPDSLCQRGVTVTVNFGDVDYALPDGSVVKAMAFLVEGE